jgi:S1/P1 Nuclease
MAKRTRYLTIFALASLSFNQLASCWGALGHRTVAYLAAHYLTPEATAFVADLINHQDISEAALWADKIRYIPGFAYSRAWHYIDAQDDPPRQCGLNFTRDCLPAQGCAVSALVNQTGRVNDASLSPWDRGQALRWILHLIGDIHQPLHTEAEDRGGNEIHVTFHGRQTNLHSVWDTAIPEKYAGRADGMVAARIWATRLYEADPNPDHNLTDECQDLDDVQTCALLWAGDANKFVCEYVLKDDVEGVEGVDLAGEYYEGAVPVIDEMITKAGRRLGAWLNALATQSAEDRIQDGGRRLIDQSSIVHDPAVEL